MDCYSQCILWSWYISPKLSEGKKVWCISDITWAIDTCHSLRKHWNAWELGYGLLLKCTCWPVNSEGWTLDHTVSNYLCMSISYKTYKCAFPALFQPVTSERSAKETTTSTSIWKPDLENCKSYSYVSSPVLAFVRSLISVIPAQTHRPNPPSSIPIGPSFGHSAILHHKWPIEFL